MKSVWLNLELRVHSLRFSCCHLQQLLRLAAYSSSIHNFHSSFLFINAFHFCHLVPILQRHVSSQLQTACHCIRTRIYLKTAVNTVELRSDYFMAAVECVLYQLFSPLCLCVCDGNVVFESNYSTVWFSRNVRVVISFKVAVVGQQDVH